ncbi:probable myosin-binding protein 4 [Gossypium hirsutum]|uniref:Probable myosin-binding protein 4 n=1 Tax=Gossypium hirsutum TaxID=3635 RepID=A0A1U8MDS1_GOSHI|nr:probable myosin-binding protein 4 [Gossypium hirsutum]
MTATVNPFPRVQRNLKGFIRVLKFAACEWMLIFLLFIDAAFSYMVTSFAQYCELQIPCILCSRLDHVFGNAKDGFYRTLFCRSHRSEISFLLSCNIHDKLVDSSGMCDECLASHVEGNESNSDMKRLVSGKLGYDGNCCSQVDEDPTSAYKFTRLCLCCNKPWIPRPSSNRSLLLKSSTSVSKPSIPVPRRLSPINDLKKMNGTVPGKTGFEHLSHVGDTEVKISSESESAFPATDNDTGGSIIRNINENKKEQADDPNESHDLRCLAPENENVVSEHKVKANFNELPELISLDNYPPTSCLMEVPSFSASLLAADLIPLVDTSTSVNAEDVPLEPENENVSVNKNDEILKLISTTTGARFEADQVADDTAMLNSTDGDPSEPEFVTKHMLTNNNEVHEDHKSLLVETIFEPSKTESDEISKLISSSTQTVFGTDRLGDDSAIVNSTDGDRIAVQELPVCGEEKSASEFVTEPTNGVNGEVQSLSGQSTSREGIHLSLNNLSPELQDRAVELLRSESNSEEVRNLQNLFFEAINDSPGLKYFEESSVIEGENPLDTLKQEVDNYRNYINA